MNNETKTFYVIKWGRTGLFHRKGGSSSAGFCSMAKTVDEAEQYPTLTAAINRMTRNTALQEQYRIVRVDRTVTPGATVRRVVQAGEVVPANAKYALVNPWSNPNVKADGSSASFFDDMGVPRTCGFSHTPLFNSLNDALRFVAVVEETLPSTTNDVLTVLE